GTVAMRRRFPLGQHPFGEGGISRGKHAGSIVSVGYVGEGIGPSRRDAPQEAAAARADDYALIFETLPAFIWTSSPTGQLEYCNRRLLDYAQRSIGELAGDGWLALVHPDDLEPTRAAWQDA